MKRDNSHNERIKRLESLLELQDQDISYLKHKISMLEIDCKLLSETIKMNWDGVVELHGGRVSYSETGARIVKYDPWWKLWRQS